MKDIFQLLDLLGDEKDFLLNHSCKTIPKDQIHIPNPSHIDANFLQSNRNGQTIRSLTQLYHHGRLSGTGYLFILHVDQGVEHIAGSSFSPNPIYFDPENIIRLAIEAGCNAVASTMGGLALLSRKYAHKIPFVVKINHNELKMPKLNSTTASIVSWKLWQKRFMIIGLCSLIFRISLLWRGVRRTGWLLVNLIKLLEVKWFGMPS